MIQNKNVLKSYFETGDKPTQQNYFDLIDSLLPMIGEIKATSFAFAPKGWRKCNGELLDPADYPELFALIGTTFGGDGESTFALPNLCGRIPLGYGDAIGLSAYNIGQIGGDESVQLTEDQLPSHTHTGSIDSGASANVAIPASNSSGTTNDSDNNYLADGLDINDEPTNLYSTSSDTTLRPFTATVSGTITTDPTGNNIDINNVQPYLAVNYIIAVEGFNPI